MIRALGRAARDGRRRAATASPRRSHVRRPTRSTASRAGWGSEPGDLVEEVRSFARRRPGVFLLGAAVAGTVVGPDSRRRRPARTDPADAQRAYDGSGPSAVSGRSTPAPPYDPLLTPRPLPATGRWVRPVPPPLPPQPVRMSRARAPRPSASTSTRSRVRPARRHAVPRPARPGSTTTGSTRWGPDRETPGDSSPLARLSPGSTEIPTPAYTADSAAPSGPYVASSGGATGSSSCLRTLAAPCRRL